MNNRQRARKLFSATPGICLGPNGSGSRNVAIAYVVTCDAGGIRKIADFGTWAEAVRWIEGYRYADSRARSDDR